MDSDLPSPVPARHQEIQEGFVDASLINSYLDNELSLNEIKDFEKSIADNKRMLELLTKKKKQKEKLYEMIPQYGISRNSRNALVLEVRDTTNNILKDPAVSFLRKVWKFLNSPL